MKLGSYHILTVSPQTQPKKKYHNVMSLALRQRRLYGRLRRNNAGKESDSETGLYYFGARYLDPKTGRWLSGDPALGEYLPSAPVSDEARKRNGNLPGMGGVFNYVNLHVYHYAGNNPVKYVDPDGRVDWVRIIGTDWWYQYHQPRRIGDRAHFHFLQGKDPRSAHARFYNRRVFANEYNPDGSIRQMNDRSGRQGHGGLDQDVPEDIIHKAIEQKGSGIISERVTVPAPLFGLLGVERLDPIASIVNPYEEGYPLWGNGNPLVMNYSITRDMETGHLNYTFEYAIDQRTGNILLGGILLPIIPGVKFFPIPSGATIPALIPGFI